MSRLLPWPVMAGRVPAIHVFLAAGNSKSRMTGTPGHDG
jgi:hypothetical protein